MTRARDDLARLSAGLPYDDAPMEYATALEDDLDPRFFGRYVEKAGQRVPNLRRTIHEIEEEIVSIHAVARRINHGRSPFRLPGAEEVERDFHRFNEDGWSRRTREEGRSALPRVVSFTVLKHVLGIEVTDAESDGN
jgi:hypothetical protein